jgi:hypothetical protein
MPVLFWRGDNTDGSFLRDSCNNCIGALLRLCECEERPGACSRNSLIVRNTPYDMSSVLERAPERTRADNKVLADVDEDDKKRKPGFGMTVLLVQCSASSGFPPEGRMRPPEKRSGGTFLPDGLRSS